MREIIKYIFLALAIATAAKAVLVVSNISGKDSSISKINNNSENITSLKDSLDNFKKKYADCSDKETDTLMYLWGNGDTVIKHPRATNTLYSNLKMDSIGINNANILKATFKNKKQTFYLGASVSVYFSLGNIRKNYFIPFNTFGTDSATTLIFKTDANGLFDAQFTLSINADNKFDFIDFYFLDKNHKKRFKTRIIPRMAA